MTIKGLNSFLSKKCPDAYGDIKYSFFKGKSIAIDVSILENKNLYGATNRMLKHSSTLEVEEEETMYNFLLLCVNFGISLLNSGIKPIFVFDGERRPEKASTSEARLKSREKTKENIKKMEEKIKNEGNTRENIDSLINLKSRREVTETHNNKLKEVLQDIGFPCLTAKYDAEKLCSMLCIYKKVDAVYSNDSDNIALGCPLVLLSHKTITKKGKRIKYFRFVATKYILKELGLKYKQFLHFCILCGTDFNSNIGGVGPVGALKYIKENKYLDSDILSEMYGYNTGCDDFLEKYEKSLEIFAKESIEECCLDNNIQLEFKLKEENLREILSENNLEDLTENIVIAYDTYKSLIS